MARFPSQEWIDKLVEIATQDDELKGIGKTWTYGGVITVLEPDENFSERWCAYFLFDKGEVKEAKIISDEKEKKSESAFSIYAKYSVWKGIVKGEIDPIQAFMRGQIKVDGNVGLLMQYAVFIRKFIDTIRKVPTEFPDEK